MTTAEKPQTGQELSVSLYVNGEAREVWIPSQATLLDVLRERLGLTGSKKGCNHGQCGACTVHVDGQAVLSCLTLTATLEGRSVTTIEGLADGEALHPVQQAFIEHDAFQCGYCTPGQIMSAIACLQTGHDRDEGDLKDFMSGNICRCAAYPQIVKAIQSVAAQGVAAPGASGEASDAAL
ncbi:(2Fe-2S)-binding protein (plasmid) [Deinococcus metallilatus]|uniref:Xanthine dehydrogenase YagT iron-sulfur-binding subunit n=1 Tax=Deinococcus metallilatus TaxID=1211322 RepID=A0ABR6MNP8_9DEIO|nr:(2Fe-2S)-binding protein [Deinococcus metallilatus]MBB5293565.1 xanthine dehydrogenase YagT iron-sulfur-binding subunit [Deinococcus metallilatus]QBY06633.1 (2Fe-2S)-binding protein [Deinococcus metallilatus]RXJ17976.1 (2Fe-2S)-binding protein [Deinococcus metallilatus]GMA15215.1 (2Fe-2S)-binding protein [Deinococcus metallilatus]